MPKKVHIFLIAILILCFELRAAESFTVMTGFSAPVSTYYARILREAGNRMGMHIDVVAVSAERSLRMVAEGKADAECCRIKQVMTSSYPSLVDVPVSFYQMSWAAFVKDKSIRVSHWDDLVNYSAVAVTGYKLGVLKVQQLSPLPYIVSTQESMFNMLERDRVQVGVGAMLDGIRVIMDLGLSDSITVIQPPIFEVPLTLQLNPKHAGLVDSFARVFSEMNQDGTSERLLAEVLDGI